MQTSQDWPQPWPQASPGHSTKEIENRLTILEEAKQSSKEDRQELFKIAEEHRDKLTLHEKLFLGILIGLSAALQDKFPKLAALLKGLT